MLLLAPCYKEGEDMKKEGLMELVGDISKSRYTYSFETDKEKLFINDAIELIKKYNLPISNARYKSFFRGIAYAGYCIVFLFAILKIHRSKIYKGRCSFNSL